MTGLPSSLVTPLAIFLIITVSACQTSSDTSSPQSSTDSSTTSTANSETAQTQNPELPEGTERQAETAAQTGTTAEETIGGLDAELDESIAVFDGMILSERAKAEASTAGAYGNEEAGADGDANESLFEEGDLNEGLPGYGEFPESAYADGEGEGEGEEANAESDGESSATEEGGDYAEATRGQKGLPGSPSGSSSDSSSDSSSGKTGGIPVDIDSGRDDDIVARQIREAAQKEKDPALREKLWDEYRKYKRQQRAS